MCLYFFVKHIDFMFVAWYNTLSVCSDVISVDLPKRKANRLKGYSYSQNGIYFLTICTRKKECILGSVVGGGDPDAPQMVLSDYGKIAKKYIESIESVYPYIEIMNYVVMPNHVHLIVMLYSDDNIYRKEEIKTSVNDIIPTMIAAFKKLVSKDIGCNIWQRSYHDHIIRNEKGFNTIWEYVDNNPARWKKDCFYCD